MIRFKIGDLLEAQDIDVLFHVCNLKHKFGAGIAKDIKQRWPEAWKADLRTPSDDPTKLGTYSVAQIHNPISRLRYVVNLYAMTGLGRHKRQLSYDRLVECFELFIKNNKNKKCTIGMPWKIGCWNAGGNWNIVHEIIVSVFEKSNMDVFIYQRLEDHLAERSMREDLLGNVEKEMGNCVFCGSCGKNLVKDVNHICKSCAKIYELETGCYSEEV